MHCLTSSPGSQDGENKNVLVAWAIVRVENTDNYDWFLARMKENSKMKDWIEQSTLVVPTDRDKGISAAVSKQIPNCLHRFCARHLLGNVKGERFKPSHEALYWKAVMALSQSEFIDIMNELAVERPEAAAFLCDTDKLDPSLWCDHAFPGLTWLQRTNNCSEQQANWVVQERFLSPVPIIKSIVLRTDQQYAERFADASKWQADATHQLTKFAHAIVMKEKDRCASLIVRVRSGSLGDEYDVFDEAHHNARQGPPSAASSHVVRNMSKNSFHWRLRSCDCKADARQLGLPCKHMLAVATNLDLYKQIFNPSTLDTWFPQCFIARSMEIYGSAGVHAACEAHVSHSPLLPPIGAYFKEDHVDRIAAKQGKKRIKSNQQHHTGDTSGVPVPTRACRICKSTTHDWRSCQLKGMSDECVAIRLEDKKAMQEAVANKPRVYVTSFARPGAPCGAPPAHLPLEEQLVLRLKIPRREEEPSASAVEGQDMDTSEEETSEEEEDEADLLEEGDRSG